VTELALDTEASRRMGVLAAAAHGVRDVVDGHVAVIALDRDAVVLTSDPQNIGRWGAPATNIVSC
jgi:predicted nucleic acid-binding protein